MEWQLVLFTRREDFGGPMLWLTAMLNNEDEQV
jgi:hypothetical protein